MNTLFRTRTPRLTLVERIVSGALIISVFVIPLGFTAPAAHAAVSDWLKGVNVVPQSPTDFSSSSFEQSMRSAKAAGANYVSLVIPYYQSNAYSTDIAGGWNTPTDASIQAAISLLHSLGMKVVLDPHVDPYDGTWRAHIDPADRDTWFKKYNDILVHLGTLGQAAGADGMVLGTELVSMASSRAHADNTSRWQSMIAHVRGVFTGMLTYGANSTNNNDDQFQNEKKFIGFWSSLDYVGLSAYYNLNTGSDDVASLKAQWDYWNNADLKAFASSVGKPLLITELGYRSVSGAHQAPWDWGRGGGYDGAEQANDYQALFEYWNDFSYMRGVFLWDWKTNPNAGGSGNTDYTPQNKPAQSIMTKYFTQGVPSGSGSSAGSGGGSSSSGHPTISVTLTPGSAAVGQSSSFTAAVSDNSGTLTGVLIDIEIYNSSNTRVYQKFYENQTLGSGQTKSYSFDWTPSSAGNYRVAFGAFQNGWASNIYWNGAVRTVSVGTAASSGGSSGSGGSGTPAGSTGASVTDIWWPTNGAAVSGAFPLKALVENQPLSAYQMYWQVDGGSLVLMGDSQTDYPHKEAWVDVSGWHWSSTGAYTITFVSKAASDGRIISSKSVAIYVK